MYKQVGAAPAESSRATTGVKFVASTWSADAISERDRREFADSLKAQAQRLNRTAMHAPTGR